LFLVVRLLQFWSLGHACRVINGQGSWVVTCSLDQDQQSSVRVRSWLIARWTTPHGDQPVHVSCDGVSVCVWRTHRLWICLRLARTQRCSTRPTQYRPEVVVCRWHPARSRHLHQSGLRLNTVFSWCRQHIGVINRRCRYRVRQVHCCRQTPSGRPTTTMYNPRPVSHDPTDISRDAFNPLTPTVVIWVQL